ASGRAAELSGLCHRPLDRRGRQWTLRRARGRDPQLQGPARAFESSGLPLHNDNQTVVRERLSLDKSNRDILHNVIATHDSALTRPWTVHKTYMRERNPRGEEYSCQPPPNAVFIGLEEYRLSPDQKLMPLRPGQPPPDLRYFRQPQK